MKPSRPGLDASTRARILRKLRPEPKPVADFSGGTPPSMHDSDGALVGISQPDFSQFDSFYDLMLDHRSTGKHPWEFVKDFFRDDINEEINHAMMAILAMPWTERTKDELRVICGAASTYDGEGIPDLGNKHGVSKQAFQQGVKKRRREIKPIKTQSERTKEARKRMQMTNTRRIKL